MICPFCGDTDFDAIGLKVHLLAYYCDEFAQVDISEVRTMNRPIIQNTFALTENDEAV